MLWQFTGFSTLHLKLSVPICSVSTFVGLCVGLSVCLSVWRWFVCLSVCQSVCVLVGLSICVSVCLWVARSVCMIYSCCSVRLSFAIAQSHTFSTLCIVTLPTHIRCFLCHLNHPFGCESI